MNESKELRKLYAYMALHQRLGSLGNGDFNEAAMACGPEEPLPYPRKQVKGPANEDIEEYEIPMEKKEEILSEMYPFSYPPSFDAELYDLHEDKYFQVKDFLVIRDHELNFLVSPYFKLTGGSVLDWLDHAPEE